jgi:hypothetical protein
MRRCFVQILLIASPAVADAAEIFTAAAVSEIAATSAAASIAGEIRNWIGIDKQSVKAKIIYIAAAGTVAAAAAAAAAATIAVIATATSYKVVKISSCIKNKEQNIILYNMGPTIPLMLTSESDSHFYFIHEV